MYNVIAYLAKRTALAVRIILLIVILSPSRLALLVPWVRPPVARCAGKDAVQVQQTLFCFENCGSATHTRSQALVGLLS